MWFKRLKRGQIYRAVKDVPMGGLVILRAAGSGGFDCIIPKDTRLVIESDSLLFTKGAYAMPLNYKELEVKIVPKEERDFFKYKEYVLCFNFEDLPCFVKELDGQVIKFDDDATQKRWDDSTARRGLK